MACRVGIVPAAGKANRFNGVYKELLPVNDDKVIMDYTLNAMLAGGAMPVIIVTSTRKISALSEHAPGLLYTIQTEGMDIMGAIYAGLRTDADEYIFGMPDTIYPEATFQRELASDFMMGTFWTDKPERFGMIREGMVVNKKEGEAGHAWGVMMWSRKVADLWRKNQPDTYTQAINQAIGEYGLATFPLKFYYDIASFDDYRDLP